MNYAEAVAISKSLERLRVVGELCAANHGKTLAAHVAMEQEVASERLAALVPDWRDLLIERARRWGVKDLDMTAGDFVEDEEGNIAFITGELSAAGNWPIAYLWLKDAQGDLITRTVNPRFIRGLTTELIARFVTK